MGLDVSIYIVDMLPYVLTQAVPIVPTFCAARNRRRPPAFFSIIFARTAVRVGPGGIRT